MMELTLKVATSAFFPAHYINFGQSCTVCVLFFVSMGTVVRRKKRIITHAKCSTCHLKFHNSRRQVLFNALLPEIMIALQYNHSARKTSHVNEVCTCHWVLHHLSTIQINSIFEKILNNTKALDKILQDCIINICRIRTRHHHVYNGISVRQS